MAATSPYLVCIPARGSNSADPNLFATTPAQDASSRVTLSVGLPFVKLGLVRFKVRSLEDGTAANFQPYLFSSSGASDPGDIAQEYAGASTAVGTLFDPAFDEPVWMQADAEGKLYMMLAPDAGADNTFYYCLRFLKAE